MDYSISQLARDFGLSRSTLLYYDRIGLLKPSARAANGYRRYGQREFERLQRICRYRELGLSLKDILRTLSTGKRPSAKVLRERLEEVEQRIRDLERHQQLLKRMLHKLEDDRGLVDVDKDLWVEMLRVAGMDEAAMERWHVEFEKRAPEGHAAFLKTLGIPAAERKRIRDWSRCGGKAGR